MKEEDKESCSIYHFDRFENHQQSLVERRYEVSLRQQRLIPLRREISGRGAWAKHPGLLNFR